MSQKFTIDDAMAQGWDLTQHNFWRMLGLVALAGFLAFIPDIAGFGIGLNNKFVAFVFVLTFAGFFIKTIMTLGLINVQLRIYDGLEVNSDHLWAPAGKFWAFLAATIVFVILVVMGTLFFVIPGIIVALLFAFYPYFLVEHRCGPIQALKASAAITSGAMWELFLLFLVLGIIEGLSALFFFVGAIPAHVFSKFTITHVYRSLLSNTPKEELGFPYERRPLRSVVTDEATAGLLSAQDQAFPNPTVEEGEATLKLSDDDLEPAAKSSGYNPEHPLLSSNDIEQSDVDNRLDENDKKP
ncbi:MAG: DUF975 family protein [Candidatus Obscuribacterales bacterium]|nr:DUF975 family protein [Candidatus Obscuribacterales bacterium]